MVESGYSFGSNHEDEREAIANKHKSIKFYPIGIATNFNAEVLGDGFSLG